MARPFKHFHKLCFTEKTPVFNSSDWLRQLHTRTSYLRFKSLLWLLPLQYCTRIVYEYSPEAMEYITRTNALQNRCYICIQWTRVIHDSL